MVILNAVKMLRRSTLLFYLVLVFLPLFAFSQPQLRNRYGDVYYDANLYKNEYASVEGSPYLEPEFKPALINDLAETRGVRFDAFQGRVEVQEKNGIIILSDSGSYVIRLQDGSGRVYETHEYVDGDGNLNVSFFEVMKEQPSYKLFLKEEISFKKAKKAEAYASAEPARFEKANETYYISDFSAKPEKLVAIPFRMNKFLALFPGKQKLIKEYIKEQQLKIRTAEDLGQIFDFYFDSL